MRLITHSTYCVLVSTVSVWFLEHPTFGDSGVIILVELPGVKEPERVHKLLQR